MVGILFLSLMAAAGVGLIVLAFRFSPSPTRQPKPPKAPKPAPPEPLGPPPYLRRWSLTRRRWRDDERQAWQRDFDRLAATAPPVDGGPDTAR